MTTSTPRIPDPSYRALTPAEIGQLKNQGCWCTHWSDVRVADGTDMRLIRDSRFIGTVRIGLLECGDNAPEQGIFDAVIQDCTIGSHVYISGVRGRLQGLTIGNNVHIENVGRIIAEPGADYGLGTAVNVLDETGSRPVYIFPGMSAQIAALMAYRPSWCEEWLAPLLEPLKQAADSEPVIGDGALVQDCRYIYNVRIGAGVKVCGASYLKNGTIISNARAGHEIAFVGNDVDAEDFIVEDGHVDSGTLMRRCYVGQGAVLEKRFTAHDSLFFANCSMENGEACAIIAGPYTVSMHKSSLLIGGEYSFFNAGSGTNSSNHKYKLGPVHWGVMQRGVKAASGAYIMWGGRIGAFSLLMGAHKGHPDTAEFPFSYLFGQSDGATMVVPALMLKSCGLMRDELKWPKRDRRAAARLPMHDHVNFEVLNPLTVGAMIQALPLLESLLKACPDPNGIIEHKGLRLKGKDIKRAIGYYTLAIAKYVNSKTKPESTTGQSDTIEGDIVWRDLCGQLLPAQAIKMAMECDSIAEIQAIFDRMHAQYPALEHAWIQQILTPELMTRISKYPDAEAQLSALVEKDRKEYLASLQSHNSAFTI